MKNFISHKVIAAHIGDIPSLIKKYWKGEYILALYHTAKHMFMFDFFTLDKKH